MNPFADPELPLPWRGIEDPIPVGTYQLLIQADGRIHIETASSSCLAILNLELDDLQADPALALRAVHPGDRDTFERLGATCLAAAEPLHWQGRLQVSGETRWVRIACRPLSQAGGSLIWDGVLIDISDLQTRELDLQRRQLRSILEQLPIPLAISPIDPDPAFLWLNRSFRDSFGYGHGSEDGLNGWMEQAYPGPLRRRFALARWQADLEMARGRSGPIPDRRDRLTCRDGSRRDVWIRAAVVDDLLVTTFLDITEHRRSELARALARRRERRQQQAELDRRLESSLTAAAMVHEIQQPLSTLLIGSQLALSSLDEAACAASPQLRILLATQLDQATQLQRTTERMRALLRNVQTPHLPVNLIDVVESALLFLRRTLQDAGIGVEIQPSATPCWVAGDGPQLQIVVTNLLRNAQHALLAAGTVRPRILLTLRHGGEGLELAVEDNGPGLPPELTAERTLNSAQARRMGQGLYVVLTTMENHGGTLQLGRSALGGAAVTLGFPALSVPPSAGASP